MCNAERWLKDLVKALKDESVIAALTAIFESFLNNVLKKVNDLQEENAELRKALVAARQTNDTLFNLRR